MATLQALGRRIESTEGLRSVVRTMKILSRSRIRAYEEAVDALAGYERTLELGLRIVLRRIPGIPPVVVGESPGIRPGIVVFGSGEGMCGPFNGRVAGFVAERFANLGSGAGRLLALGDYVAAELESVLRAPDRVMKVPESVEAIGDAVHALLAEIDGWRAGGAIDRVVLCHNLRSGAAGYGPTERTLLPIDPAWLRRLEREPWPGRSLPAFTMERDALLSSLVRQVMFEGLYRGFAESLAAENASRLGAMRVAEERIEERLVELRTEYHTERQGVVTREVIEVSTGYEALREA